MHCRRLGFVSCLILALASFAGGARGDERLDRLKRDALENVEGRKKLTQVMVDSIFSFGELGFQELETSRYVTGILEENGFSVERGAAGIPPAWGARWR